MKLKASIFPLGVSVVIAASGAGLKQPITHEMTLDAIMRFRVDPLSEDARQAGAVVMQFVDQSTT